MTPYDIYSLVHSDGAIAAAKFGVIITCLNIFRKCIETVTRRLRICLTIELDQAEFNLSFGKKRSEK
jgi:hypothetical protein